TLQSASNIGAEASTVLTVGGAGVIQDTGKARVPAPDLTKVGAGTAIFQNQNSYTGLTDVSQGILQIQNAGALGFPLVSEVQQFTLFGPLTGFFTLTFTGGGTTQTTRPIRSNWDVTNEYPGGFTKEVQDALELLPNIGPGNVVVTQVASTFTVTFQG